MTTARVFTSASVLTLAFALGGAAQQAPPAPAPPVRQLGPITAVSRDSLSSVAAAVQVAGGRVLVNDILARRVLLYDSTLSSVSVVADSASGGANAYGSRPGTLLRFRGDSALFITPAALSMLVLDPTGNITRTMAMPPSGSGLPALLGNIFGTPGFDARGRLAYFSPVRMQFRGPPPSNGPTAMEPPESAFVVRFDLASRTLDTAAVLHIQRSRTSITRGDDGRMHITLTAFPQHAVDDWAVLPDGSIAVVRGRDYHLDRLNPDGSWSSFARIPYPWERLDDSAKTALLDSTAAAMQANMDSMQARLQRNAPPTGPGGNTAAPGGARGERRAEGAGGGLVMTFVGPGGDAERRGGGAGPTSVNFQTPQVVRAELADVPDYRPPFRPGAVRADAEGNLWIRTNTVVDGRPVYDVVNRDGQLVDRVQLPAFRTVAGFGPGVVYMGVQDSSGVMHVEKARVR